MGVSGDVPNDRDAAALLAVLYDELCRLAAARMVRRGRAQVTAISCRRRPPARCGSGT
jgi:hypothetical protein